MFKQLENIDTAFKYTRTVSLYVIVSCVLLSSYAIYKSYSMVLLAQERVYILSNGKAMEAFAAERKDNVPVEAKDHIKTFHRYFFSLDPDEKVIIGNIGKALYLADASAKRQYDNLKEAGYYINLISSNMSQEIQVDSIQLNFDRQPYYFKCFATELLIRTTTTVSRSLTTEGYLRNVSRSDNNPHGFLIEKWNILENKDLQTKNR